MSLDLHSNGGGLECVDATHNIATEHSRHYNAWPCRCQLLLVSLASAASLPIANTHAGRVTCMSFAESHRECVAQVQVLERDFKLHINVVAFGCLLLFLFKAPAKASKATKWASPNPTPKEPKSNM